MSTEITSHNSRRVNSNNCYRTPLRITLSIYFAVIAVNQIIQIYGKINLPCITGYTTVSRQQSHPRIIQLNDTLSAELKATKK